MKNIFIFVIVFFIFIALAGATRYFTYEFENDIKVICSECSTWISCKSNSMGYTLGCNDTIIGTEPSNRKQIKTGDIIIYRRHKSDNRTKLKYIIHRIIGKDYRNCYITKGDNNGIPDKYHPCFYDIKYIIKGVIYG